MRAISIRQPWAWLIVNGYKPVENREWPTKYRGPVLIHAGQTLARRHYEDLELDMAVRLRIALPAYEDLPRGGVVGVATIVDCVTEFDSPFFTGPFGFVLKDARPLPFQPFKGKLGFFDVPGYADLQPRLALDDVGVIARKGIGRNE